MNDKRAGASRDDSRAGVILGNMDDTPGFIRERDNAEAMAAQVAEPAVDLRNPDESDINSVVAALEAIKTNQ